MQSRDGELTDFDCFMLTLVIMGSFESIFDLILNGIITETSRVENKFNRLSSSEKTGLYMETGRKRPNRRDER